LSARALSRSYNEYNWGNQISSIREAVKRRDNWKRVGREPQFREDLSTETGIAIVRSRYQEKTSQDTAGFSDCKLWKSAIIL
jgi:hypothetical protein